MSDPDTTPGGWCGPYGGIYDAGLLTSPDLPEVVVPRGGITYRVMAPAERRAYEAVQARMRRTIDTLSARQHDTIEAACLTAWAEAYDVHLYRRDAQLHTLEDRVLAAAYIGIEFQPARYPVPTIVEHLDHDVSWTDDDEWEA